ncbi:MAG: hypothetical protein Q8O92_14405 [Candidatus Latescibacter sp.]|nr:hypothetical protein [Candidatus Latescibacter sp.]
MKKEFFPTIPFMFCLFLLLMGIPALSPAQKASQSEDVIHTPYTLSNGLESRSISFENPTGARGQGGKEASPRMTGTARLSGTSRFPINPSPARCAGENRKYMEGMISE